MTAVPDRSRRLSDGVIVEAFIRARVLGIRLLTLDASVVLVPADLSAASSADQDPPLRGTVRSPLPAPLRSGAGGRRLAEAVRTLQEGAELLAQVRRNGA